MKRQDRDARLGKFKSHLSRARERLTLARREILDAVESLGSVPVGSGARGMKHFNADDVHMAARRACSPVSLASVYRALPLLCSAGVLRESAKRNGRAIYEIVTEEQDHDHIVCVECGRIVEFREERLEKLQEEICVRLGFHQTGHSHCIRGLCHKCSRKLNRRPDEEVHNSAGGQSQQR